MTGAGAINMPKQPIFMRFNGARRKIELDEIPLIMPPPTISRCKIPRLRHRHQPERAETPTCGMMSSDFGDWPLPFQLFRHRAVIDM